MNAGKSIMIFGGSRLQASIIRNAGSMGFYTIVMDIDENAFAVDICDEFIHVAGEELRLAKRYIEESGIQGIITTATDKPLRTMAEIADEFNLPFPSYRSILMSTDKYLMKEAFVAHGVPCARGILVEGKQGISPEEAATLHPPFIIKPVDGSGSRGVILCGNEGELVKALGESIVHSSSGRVLIEEYLEGPELSVEGVVSENTVRIVQFSDKITTPPPYNVEIGHIQPSVFYEKAYDEIVHVVEEAVRALGLDNCAIHPEIRMTPEGPKVVEIGARLGGDYMTSHLVPASTGVNIERAAIDIATGKRPETVRIKNAGACIKYLVLEEGEVVKVDDWEDVMELEGVIDAELILNKGDTVGQITNSLNRYGFIIAEGEDRSAAEKNADHAVEYIVNRIIVE